MSEVTTTSPEEAALAKAKASAERKFDLVKTGAFELSIQVNEIEIEDENTLSIATQTLTKANDFFKQIEKRRTDIKSPYVKMGKMIDQIAASVNKPLGDAIAGMKVKMRDWNKKQEAEANAKNKENEVHLTRLNAISAQLKEKTDACASSEKAKLLIHSIETKFPPFEEFGSYANQAKETKDAYIQILRIKTKVTEAAEDGKRSPDTVDNLSEIKAVEESLEENLAISKEIVDENSTALKSKTRKIWKFEITDDKALARQFLSADDKKIREYMNAKKDTFGTEKTVAGVRFFLDEVPVI